MNTSNMIVQMIMKYVHELISVLLVWDQTNMYSQYGQYLCRAYHKNICSSASLGNILLMF